MKPFAIVASIVIVVACLIYGLTFVDFGSGPSDVDTTKTVELSADDHLVVESFVSRINVTTDPGAAAATAHLYGSVRGIRFSGNPDLTVERGGGTVSVRAGQPGPHIVVLGWNTMTLDIVLPAGYAGQLEVRTSAGAVQIDSDLVVESLLARSSAGRVTVRNVTATGDVEVASSAGAVETGAVKAKNADIYTSAGRVRVAACEAETIRLSSSAGSVEGRDLAGAVDANSSAGSVDVELLSVVGNVRANSSAGRVTVTIPASANADVNVHSSAGSAECTGLQVAFSVQKKDRLEGTLGQGGPMVEVSSSAGSAELIGK